MKYWGKDISEDKIIHQDDNVTRYLDDITEHFYYGHDVFKSGQIIKWMRPKEDIKFGS